MVDDMQALRGDIERIAQALERIADSLAELSCEGEVAFSPESASAFVWQSGERLLKPVSKVSCVALELLQGIDLQKALVLENTRRFAEGYVANNVLLWGSRGSGKSSLVKSVHAELASQHDLKLIEIHRDDIADLSYLLDILRGSSCRIIVFCDDLSFECEDVSYKALKAVLEGGIEGRPDNVIFYATSNRRHMMARHMIENEEGSAINPYEAVEEKVSLSDRFGLWVGFHSCSQEVYLRMIEAYIGYYDIGVKHEEWRPQAIEWAVTRGSRSGRVAWQFIQDLASRHKKPLES